MTTASTQLRAIEGEIERLNVEYGEIPKSALNYCAVAQQAITIAKELEKERDDWKSAAITRGELLSERTNDRDTLKRRLDEAMSLIEVLRTEERIRNNKLTRPPHHRDWQAMSEKQTGIQLIEAERQRQIDKEKWTFEHDDEHKNGDLRDAAEAYLLQLRRRGHWSEKNTPEMWPWDREFWKPSADPIRQLVKAGALIAAELDRLQRLTP